MQMHPVRALVSAKLGKRGARQREPLGVSELPCVPGHLLGSFLMPNPGRPRIFCH